ncbi:MAG: MarR family transcriptional regulator [Ilumatobacteraceae bacterium]
MPFAAEPDSAAATARVGRAWRELRRGPSTTKLMDDLVGRHDDDGAIEPGQLDILDILAVRDDRRMSDLAASLHVDPSTVTRTLQRMEHSGLASRAGTPDDGRVVTVHLTDEGRRVHAAVSARRAEMLDGILGAFTPDELDQLAGLLDRLVTSIQAYAATVVRDREQAPG